MICAAYSLNAGVLTCFSATAIPAIVYWPQAHKKTQHQRPLFYPSYPDRQPQLQEQPQSDAGKDRDRPTHVVVRTSLASREDGVVNTLLQVRLLVPAEEEETRPGASEGLVPVREGSGVLARCAGSTVKRVETEGSKRGREKENGSGRTW